MGAYPGVACQEAFLVEAYPVEGLVEAYPVEALVNAYPVEGLVEASLVEAYLVEALVVACLAEECLGVDLGILVALDVGFAGVVHAGVVLVGAAHAGLVGEVHADVDPAGEAHVLVAPAVGVHVEKELVAVGRVGHDLWSLVGEVQCVGHAVTVQFGEDHEEEALVGEVPLDGVHVEEVPFAGGHVEEHPFVEVPDGVDQVAEVPLAAALVGAADWGLVGAVVGGSAEGLAEGLAEASVESPLFSAPSILSLQDLHSCCSSRTDLNHYCQFYL